MSSQSGLVRNAIFSSMQAAVGGLLMLVLYRVLFDVLGAPMLGAWSLISAFVGLTKLSELGFSAALVRYVADALGREQPGEVGDLVTTIALVVSGLVGAVLLAVYPMLEWAVTLLIQGRLSPQSSSEIEAVLPVLLLTLWFGTAKGVAACALEGFQRYDILRTVGIATMLVSFALTIWVVPTYGITGVALVNLIVSIVAGLSLTLLLIVQFGRVRVRSYRLRWHWVGRLFGYGSRAQLMAILVALLDPATKALLTHFGGLPSVAYFTMANRAVMQVRNLVMAAFRVTVPFFASLQARDPAQIPPLYNRAVNVLALVGVPPMALVMAGIPSFFAVWLGRWDEHFTVCGLIVAVTWTVNLVCAPVFYLQLGLGRLGKATLAHVVILGVTVSTGALLGWSFGAYGVVLGYCAGQLAGTFTVLAGSSDVGVARPMGVLSSQSVFLVLAAALAAPCAAALSLLLAPTAPSVFLLLGTLATVGCVLLPFMWAHPERRALTGLVTRVRKVRA